MVVVLGGRAARPGPCFDETPGTKNVRRLQPRHLGMGCGGSWRTKSGVVAPKPAWYRGVDREELL